MTHPVERRSHTTSASQRLHSAAVFTPTRLQALPFARGARGLLLSIAGLTAIALIGLLDYGTGPDLSFGVFYFLPVAAVAWWGGLAHGLLLSLASACAWHAVDWLDGVTVHPVVQTWNDLVRFSVLAISSSLLTRLRAAMHHERLLARTDPLTGAANARTFYEALGAEARWSREMGRPLTLAYLDLDNFKQLNDCLGHSVGDKALRHLAQTIRHVIRAEDTLARLGGDEFALLLPETGSREALRVLERVHLLLTQEMERQGWAVTASVGAATFLLPPADVDLMIHRVDTLMYAVKRLGKNRLEHEEVDGEGELRPRAERRGAERLPCDRAVRIWSEELDGGEELATVLDVSMGGLGLYARQRIAPRSVVMVQPTPEGTGKAVLARVVRSVSAGEGWFHGCVLYTRLKEEELREWVVRAAPEEPPPNAALERGKLEAC
ncbi:MAG: diguanylate cyclase [Gemmataceae bacterium]|nr:diguanylate cyclase [Gemmataceae bacterium]